MSWFLRFPLPLIIMKSDFYLKSIWILILEVITKTAVFKKPVLSPQSFLWSNSEHWYRLPQQVERE